MKIIAYKKLFYNLFHIEFYNGKKLLGCGNFKFTFRVRKNEYHSNIAMEDIKWLHDKLGEYIHAKENVR